MAKFAFPPAQVFRKSRECSQEPGALRQLLKTQHPTGHLHPRGRIKKDHRAGYPAWHMVEQHWDLLQSPHQASYFTPEDEEGLQSWLPAITHGRASPGPPATTPPGILLHPWGCRRTAELGTRHHTWRGITGTPCNHPMVLRGCQHNASRELKLWGILRSEVKRVEKGWASSYRVYFFFFFPLAS